MNTRTTYTALANSSHSITENGLKEHRSIFSRSDLVFIAVLIVALAAALHFKPAASPAKLNSAPGWVYDATAAMRKSVIYSWEAPAASVNRVYDATAAMRKAVVYSWEVPAAPVNRVYDATAAMRKAVVYSWEVPAASPSWVYDATAAMRKSVVYSWEVQPVPSKTK